jgi:hypothetical protein
MAAGGDECATVDDERHADVAEVVRIEHGEANAHDDLCACVRACARGFACAFLIMRASERLRT